MSSNNGIIINGEFYNIPPIGQFVDSFADKVAQLVLDKIRSESIIEADEFYSVAETAKATRKSEATITRHCRKGLLKANKVGKSWLIPVESYDRYINSRNLQE